MEVIQGQILLLVLCLTKLALNANSLNITTVHYIVPALSSCPNGRECTDIGTLLNESERYFTSNTKVIFQPGTHIIDSSINKSILVYNVNDLVITGDSKTSGGQPTNSRAILLCQAEFNIIIVQSENVHIDNLELLKCGASINRTDFYSQTRSSLYKHLRLSDFYRRDAASKDQSLRYTESFSPAQFATIYILDCVNVTVENTSIERSLSGVTLLTVNVYGVVKVTGCSFKGLYCVWYIDKYIDPPAENEISYTIKNSHFLSVISVSSEPQEQEAVTLIVRWSKERFQQIVFNLVIENTTIQGQAGVNEGYILRVIVNATFFDVLLNKLNSCCGKQLYVQNSFEPVEIKVFDSVFREGSSFYIEAKYFPFIYTLNLMIVIENLLISDAVDPLHITRSTAYLRNVTIEGTTSTGISLIQSEVFFEGNNKISSCFATENLESELSLAVFTTYTGGLFSSNSTVTFRGEMYFDSNNGDQNGAITAGITSTFKFEGKIIFTDNIGYNGGAIGLYDNSVIIINRIATVSFIRNHAINYGGAIYVPDDYLQCFYEPAEWDNSIDYRVLNYVNNTASEAGDTI